MAIGTPTLIGSVDNQTAGTSAVIAVPAGGVPAGALIVVILCCHEDAVSPTCADDQSNTYTDDVFDVDHADQNVETHFYRAENVTALAEAENITVSWTTDAQNSAIAAYVTGIATTNPLDQTAIAEGQETTDTLDSGNITTTQADEVIFGAFGMDAAVGRTVTEDGDFTLLGNIGGGGGRQSHLAYRVVSATETNNYAPTGFGASDEWHALIASYKASALGRLLLLNPPGLDGGFGEGLSL